MLRTGNGYNHLLTKPDRVKIFPLHTSLLFCRLVQHGWVCENLFNQFSTLSDYMSIIAVRFSRNGNTLMINEEETVF